MTTDPAHRIAAFKTALKRLLAVPHAPWAAHRVAVVRLKIAAIRLGGVA